METINALANTFERNGTEIKMLIDRLSADFQAIETTSIELVTKKVNLLQSKGYLDLGIS